MLVFEHKHLLGHEGEIADQPTPIELGVADVVRSGDDVTVLATQWMRLRAEEAAERLAGEGVSVEIIDPRTVVPFDYDTVGKSLDRTNHLVVVQECSNDGSWGATVVARLMADHFESLTRHRCLSAVTRHRFPIPERSRSTGYRASTASLRAFAARLPISHRER